MWVMMNRGFVSAVEHRDNPNALVVRARAEAHLETVNELLDFAGIEAGQIFETLDADYRFRMTIEKEEFAAAMTAYIFKELTYPNFKGSVLDQRYHDALLRVWTTMYTLQQNVDGSAFVDPRQATIFEEPAGLMLEDPPTCSHANVQAIGLGAFVCSDCGEVHERDDE